MTCTQTGARLSHTPSASPSPSSRQRDSSDPSKKNPLLHENLQVSWLFFIGKSLRTKILFTYLRMPIKLKKETCLASYFGILFVMLHNADFSSEIFSLLLVATYGKKLNKFHSKYFTRNVLVKRSA